MSTLSSNHAPALSLMSMATPSKKMTNQATRKLKITSSQQAIQLVKRQYSGKILKVQSSRVKGNSGYRVKLLSSAGAVFYVSVDAKTGRVHRN
ncbi:MAG: PepSY domain-containing protein [Shewanella sp.]